MEGYQYPRCHSKNSLYSKTDKNQDSHRYQNVIFHNIEY